MNNLETVTITLQPSKNSRGDYWIDVYIRESPDASPVWLGEVTTPEEGSDLALGWVHRQGANR